MDTYCLTLREGHCRKPVVVLCLPLPRVCFRCEWRISLSHPTFNEMTVPRISRRGICRVLEATNLTYRLL